MDNKTQVVKHLEMIQGVINRLGHDSFIIKGWSVAILSAGIIFIARGEGQSKMVVIALLIPVIGFWILDGYFLRQERLFREVYNEIRKQGCTDFAMDTKKHEDKPDCSRRASIFSRTLSIFYVIIEGIFVLAVFVILNFWDS